MQYLGTPSNRFHRTLYGVFTLIIYPFSQMVLIPSNTGYKLVHALPNISYLLHRLYY